MSRWVQIVCVVLVSGCGGGEDPPENQAPIANAGADRSVAEGMQATLDGAGSSDADGTLVSYVWTQLSGPSVTVVDETSAHAHFIAPLVDTPTTLEMQLDVTDDDGLVASDTVVLTIDEVDTTPDPFAFADAIDVVAESVVVSAPTTLAGFNAQLPISIVGGSYAIDSEAPEAFTTAPGIVEPTDVIRLRTTAAASGTTSVTLTVGSVSATWNVTAAPPPNAPSATLHFPVGSAEIPTDTIRVRGEASAVLGRNLTGVTIEVGALSVAAALDPDGTFRADVPLAHGNNALVVHVFDDMGGVNDAAAITHVRREHPIRLPAALAWDAPRARLVAMDNIADPGYHRKSSTLVAFDPATTRRATVCSLLQAATPQASSRSRS